MTDRLKRQQQQQLSTKPLETTLSKVSRKKYPRTMRVIESVPCPPTHRLTIKDIFGSSGWKSLSRFAHQ